MGKKDVLTKKYMQNPEIFADFVNGYLYHGEEIIRSNSLEEVDVTGIAIFPAKENEKPIAIQKMRDVLKRTVLMKSDKVFYLLLGIENQSEVYYAMPVKNMLYDALVYSNQVDIISKENRDKGICKNYLSGINPEDKLIPIITMTLYWGDKPWDAPVTLKEMLSDVDPEIEKYINNYDCNLFSVMDVENLPQYKTELGELFMLMRTRNKWKDMETLANTNERFRHISKETAQMIRVMANIKLPRKNKEGEYNMCKAIQEMEKIYTEAGEKRGKEIGERIGRDDALTKAIRSVIETTKKSYDEACAIMGLSDAEKQRYRSLI